MADANQIAEQSNFGFKDKNAISMTPDNIAAITQLGNIREEWLKTTKNVPLTDFLLDGEAYKPRFDLTIAGYPASFIDRAAKVLKLWTYQKGKGNGGLYAFYAKEQPIVITTETELNPDTIKALAVVIAPRIES